MICTLKQSALKLQAGFTERLHIALKSWDCPKPNFTGRKECLEDIFGMNYQTVRKWLNGTHMPESRSLAYVANRLGVRLEWLMTGKGKMDE